MKTDTIRLLWSLAICCCDCPRIVEWTPPMLEEKFRAKLDTTIAALNDRMTCKGSDYACGSEAIALFPHPYDLPWRWTPDGA